MLNFGRVFLFFGGWKLNKNLKDSCVSNHIMSSKTTVSTLKLHPNFHPSTKTQERPSKIHVVTNEGIFFLAPPKKNPEIFEDYC